MLPNIALNGGWSVCLVWERTVCSSSSRVEQDTGRDTAWGWEERMLPHNVKYNALGHWVGSKRIITSNGSTFKPTKLSLLFTWYLKSCHTNTWSHPVTCQYKYQLNQLHESNCLSFISIYLLFMHLDVVKTTCWSLKWASERGKKWIETFKMYWCCYKKDWLAKWNLMQQSCLQSIFWKRERYLCAWKFCFEEQNRKTVWYGR